MVIVQKSVKSYISSKDMQTAGDLSASLEKEVYNLLDKAIYRAKSANRKTVMKQDL